MTSSEPRLGTIREVYDGSLTSDIQVATFRHMDRLFPVRVVPHGDRILALPRRTQPLSTIEFTSGGKPYDLVDYLALNRVTGLLVLKRGEIALEDYEMGNTAATRWVSMSVAKTVTATLAGAALRDGHIKSLDEEVTAYVPQLAGSAYDGVSIRFLLEMASGVKWDETYTNPRSDRRRMLDAQILQRPGGRSPIIYPSGSGAGPAWNATPPGGSKLPTAWKSAAAVCAPRCAITAA